MNKKHITNEQRQAMLQVATDAWAQKRISLDDFKVLASRLGYKVQEVTALKISDAAPSWEGPIWEEDENHQLNDYITTNFLN